MTDQITYGISLLEQAALKYRTEQMNEPQIKSSSNGYYISKPNDDEYAYMREDGSWHKYMTGAGGTYFNSEADAQKALDKATNKSNRDVIWCPDDQSPVFLATLQGLWKGMEPEGNLVPVIGSYKGDSEFAFICSENDFNELVVQNGWVDNQESVLILTRCNKQYAVLHFHNGDTVGIGSLKQVSQEEALLHDAWTYNPEMNAWFIAVQENPDMVPPPEGWNADYIRVPKDARKFWRDKRGIHNDSQYIEGFDYSDVADYWELCVVIPR